MIVIDILGPTVSGGYNIFGTDGDGFSLQGNLTREGLEQLEKRLQEFKASEEWIRQAEELTE